MSPGRVVALLIALGYSGSALAAGPFELFGFNPRAKAMAGAHTAAAQDYTATFYNPALLTTRATLNFGAAISFVQPNTYIELEQPQPEDSRYAPELPGTEGGLALGFDFPVGGKLGDHLALGLGAYLPATEIARIRVLDPAVPQFYLYEAGPARMEVMPAVAVRWLDWLSTGVGLRATGGLDGPTYYTVDPVAGTVEHREFDTALVYRLAPTLGVALGPFFGFRLGATYRGALSMSVNFPNNLDLAGMDLGMAMRVGTETVYSPHTAVLGIAYQAFDGALTLSADLQYVRWSDAPDPSVSFVLDTEGEDLEHLGLGDALDIPAPGMERTVRPGFRDTWLPRVGLEFAPLDFLFVRAGYFYQPTPVPNQTSGSNYVDNNAHALSSGVGVVFSDPLEIFANPIAVDAAAQVLLLMERTARKADGNDPIGDWRAGGQIFDFSLSIIYAY